MENLKVFGLNSLTNGGGNSTTSEQLQLHDFIPLSLRTKDRIFEKCAPLYKNGMSLRDIEERTGISKFLITKSFLKNNLPIRDFKNVKNLPEDCHSYKKVGQPPYGFTYLDGKLVLDPKEHLIVRKIMSLWHRGMSMRAIALELTAKKITNRKGTKWHHGVISSIIKHQKKLKQMNIK
jgi:hypothetical protein